MHYIVTIVSFMQSATVNVNVCVCVCSCTLVRICMGKHLKPSRKFLKVVELFQCISILTKQNSRAMQRDKRITKNSAREQESG